MYDEAPMLPYDYIVSFIISICPYMWKSVMDKRVDALKNKENYPKEEENKAHVKVIIYYSCFIAALFYLTFSLSI
jgi:hypothetical protein